MLGQNQTDIVEFLRMTLDETRDSILWESTGAVVINFIFLLWFITTGSMLSLFVLVIGLAIYLHYVYRSRLILLSIEEADENLDKYADDVKERLMKVWVFAATH